MSTKDGSVGTEGRGRTYRRAFWEARVLWVEHASEEEGKGKEGEKKEGE